MHINDKVLFVLLVKIKWEGHVRLVNMKRGVKSTL